MPFTNESLLEASLIDVLQSAYSSLNRRDIKARLYVFVLTRGSVVNYLMTHQHIFRLPISFSDLQRESYSSAQFMEFLYNHLENCVDINGSSGTSVLLFDLISTILNDLFNDLVVRLGREFNDHSITQYMTVLSGRIESLPSFLFTVPSSENRILTSSTPTITSGQLSRVRSNDEEISAHTILEGLNVTINPSISNVNEELQHTEQGLRRRSSGEGLDSPLHNARLFYSSCFGLYKNKMVYISNFDGEVKPKARVHELQNNVINDAYVSVFMDLVKMEFNFEFGWVHTPSKNLFSYTAYVPGNYLKGASKKNTKILGTILSDNPLAPFISGDYSRTEHIEGLFKREFTSFEEGINSKKEIFIVSPHVLVCSRKIKEKVQKKVYFNTTVVGVLNEKYRYVKIYKKFTGLLPLLRGVIPYEIR